MKNILIGLLTLTSISAFAGTYGLPDQDPVVKVLRDKYLTAKQPTIAQLQIGKLWNCKEFNAFKDSFGNTNAVDLLSFAQFDDLIVNVSGHSQVGTMAFIGSDLTGLKKYSHDAFYIRADAEGNLMIENTATAVSHVNGVASISNNSLFVYSYLICPVSTIH